MEKLSLLELTMKTVMLILLATFQRGQTMQALSLDAMHRDDTKIIFPLKLTDLKQGRPGYKPKLLQFKKFHDPELCIFSHLCHYITCTEDIRENERHLFLTSVKPHIAASRDTISRWVKHVMCKAGINVQMFKPGSTRAASSSQARKAGVPLEEVLQTGGWSQETTFSKWYRKSIVTATD